MKIAALVLDYLQALIWPALVVFCVIYLRQPIRSLAERLVRESGEISAAGLGFELTARFREKLGDLAESAETAGGPELRESMKQTAADLLRDEFRALASNFYDAPAAVRREAAREMKRVAAELPLDELLNFAKSPSNGERVGAAIGLGVHMQSGRGGACGEPRVRTAIARLLDDSNSRVRYRAAGAILGCPEFLETLEPRLTQMAEEDPHKDVRQQARRTLDK